MTVRVVRPPWMALMGQMKGDSTDSGRHLQKQPLAATNDHEYCQEHLGMGRAEGVEQAGTCEADWALSFKSAAADADRSLSVDPSTVSADAALGDEQVFPASEVRRATRSTKRPTRAPIRPSRFCTTLSASDLAMLKEPRRDAIW